MRSAKLTFTDAAIEEIRGVTRPAPCTQKKQVVQHASLACAAASKLVIQMSSESAYIVATRRATQSPHEPISPKGR